jgi:hypothetical protein
VAAIGRGLKGSWGTPLTPGEHRGKLEDCIGRAVAAPRAEQIIGALERLEQLDAQGVAALAAWLTERSAN